MVELIQYFNSFYKSINIFKVILMSYLQHYNISSPIMCQYNSLMMIILLLNLEIIFNLLISI